MCNCSQCSQRIYSPRLGHKVGVDSGAQEWEHCDQDICGSSRLGIKSGSDLSLDI